MPHNCMKHPLPKVCQLSNTNLELAKYLIKRGKPYGNHNYIMDTSWLFLCAVFQIMAWHTAVGSGHQLPLLKLDEQPSGLTVSSISHLLHDCLNYRKS